jgi:hypothetical protein
MQKGDNTERIKKRDKTFEIGLIVRQIENLKGFHMATLVHAIDNERLYYQAGNELNIAKTISDEMNHILQSPA